MPLPSDFDNYHIPISRKFVDNIRELFIDQYVKPGDLLLDIGNQGKYKKEKKYLDVELEEQTLTYILEFYNSEKEKCKELLNKKFSYPIFNELIEKLTVINFDMKQLDKIDISEEKREIVTKLKLRGDNDIKDKQIYFRAIYFGWFKREIEEEQKKTEEKNDKIKKIELKKILSKLKNINKIDEIEQLYNEFILIRRPNYV